MEVKNLPPLPWKRPKAPRQARAKNAQVGGENAESSLELHTETTDEMVCARCGRQFENKMQYKLGPGGSHICKGHCAPSRPALISGNFVTAD